MRTEGFVKYGISFFIALSYITVFAQSKLRNTNEKKIDIAGAWSFQVDSLDLGIKNRWYSTTFKETVKLPGSMLSNGKGDPITIHTPWTGSLFDSSWFHKPEYAKYRKPGNIKVPFWLQPEKYYKGIAWYQKVIDIPSGWNGEFVELFLERCHWETQVWVDGVTMGTRNSLGTPHVYDLGAHLKPGKHSITIRVDNGASMIDIGPNSHSITDHTQTNWNGIVGKMYLSVIAPVRLGDVQVYPDIHKKQIVVKAQIEQNGTLLKSAQLLLSVKSLLNNENNNKPIYTLLKLKSGHTEVRLVYPMVNPQLWSEFNPALYRLSAKLIVGNGRIADLKAINFGMREFTTLGTNFVINGQATFLRGTLECAAFPKTGFPPTDIIPWLRIFKTCKEYGLNHVRFHSWCPPEAAFDAADKLGVYLQIECSSWANQGATIGDGKPLDKYLYQESNDILKAYGNHPSFCMMAYGNEPAGKNLIPFLTKFVNFWKIRDPRRLYTTASGWPIIPQSDYNDVPDPRIQHWDEGLKSIINSHPPSTDYDWNAIISKWQHPTVSHEIGQWCVYPDFKEIAKYDGVLKAKNFEIFRDRLQENGLGNYADDFLFASGKLQALCYKADIEAALRTRGFGGFQLLGLYDFPGQGTALVGVLNAFWQDKGYINAQQYRQFCNAVVPLIRFPKMVYLNDEDFDVPVEIAQFGSNIISHTIPEWNIKNEQGEILYHGRMASLTIPFGNCIPLGRIHESLKSILVPSKLTISVNVAGYHNEWNIFVYPKHLPKIDSSIYVTRTLDSSAVNKLKQGGKVLLTLKKGALRADKGGDIPVGFSSIFWNTAWTNGQPPFTLGILCDPKHPALAEFPTEKYSDYQWWDAMTHANVIKLDAVLPGLRPIVRVIDDWVTARSLGLVFECKVGNGKLIVSGIDLLTNQQERKEAVQLLYSLTHYMEGKNFDPTERVSLENLKSLTN